MSELNELFSVRRMEPQRRELASRDAVLELHAQDGVIDAKTLQVCRLHLEPFAPIRELRLSGCGLGECGAVQQLEGLVVINLSRNALQRLPRLFGASGLREVNVSGNQLSAPAIDRLLQELAAAVSEAGSLDYGDNPGSDDAQRSVAGRNARFILERLGWKIRPNEPRKPLPAEANAKP